jgi:gliding motility-associated-like protein
MIVNGGQIIKRIWSEIIPVKANTNYLFSGWVCSVYTASTAQISFEVNGNGIGNINAPASTNTWIQFSGMWNSGSNTSAILVLRDLNNNWNGNDFGIDDISFQECLSCNNPGPELLLNSDFSAGNVSFTSGYPYITPDSNYGQYYIVQNPTQWDNPPFATHCLATDHTTGTGNMLVVDGATTPNVPVYCQTVNVSANTTYTFSLWALSTFLGTYPYAVLDLRINSSSVSVFNLTAPNCVWNQFSTIWNSGSASTANICLVDQNTNGTGNDFALDDLSFRKCVSCSAPQISLSGNATICKGTSTVLSANGGTTYSWSTGASASSISVSPSSSTNYFVIGTDSCGSDTAFLNVTVHAPNISVSGNATITQGQTTTLTAYGGGNYSWNNGETSSSIAVSPTATSQYCAAVTDTTGCIDSICITVYVKIQECKEEIFLPNAFSPNGDNENDFLIVQGTKCVKTFYLAIYNRWGEKVFETADFAKGWDGFYNGKKEKTEVYSYYLEGVYTSGNTFNKKGNISLLR